MLLYVESTLLSFAIDLLRIPPSLSIPNLDDLLTQMG